MSPLAERVLRIIELRGTRPETALDYHDIAVEAQPRILRRVAEVLTLDAMKELRDAKLIDQFEFSAAWGTTDQVASDRWWLAFVEFWSTLGYCAAESCWRVRQ